MLTYYKSSGRLTTTCKVLYHNTVSLSSYLLENSAHGRVMMENKISAAKKYWRRFGFTMTVVRLICDA